MARNDRSRKVRRDLFNDERSLIEKPPDRREPVPEQNVMDSQKSSDFGHFSPPRGRLCVKPAWARAGSAAV